MLLKKRGLKKSVSVQTRLNHFEYPLIQIYLSLVFNDLCTPKNRQRRVPP